MKSWHVHYLNKYPGGHVQSSENSIDVYDVDGNHRIAIRKGGDGMFACVSEEYGLPDRHDLAPIPKDSRVHKVVGGKIGLDEEHEERVKVRKDYLDESGKVLSCEELKKKGFKFDEKQRKLS